VVVVAVVLVVYLCLYLVLLLSVNSYTYDWAPKIYQKLSYRRRTARRAMSVEILSIAA